MKGAPAWTSNASSLSLEASIVSFLYLVVQKVDSMSQPRTWATKQDCRIAAGCPGWIHTVAACFNRLTPSTFCLTSYHLWSEFLFLCCSAPGTPVGRKTSVLVRTFHLISCHCPLSKVSIVMISLFSSSEFSILQPQTRFRWLCLSVPVFMCFLYISRTLHMPSPPVHR